VLGPIIRLMILGKVGDFLIFQRPSGHRGIILWRDGQHYTRFVDDLLRASF